MRKTFIILLALFVMSSGLFLLYGVESHWWLIVQLRLVKWWGLVIVGIAVGVATLLFQTITNNIILTPSIIGFDALFILLQTILLLTLGVTGFAYIDPVYNFFVSLALMSVLATLLFAPLIRNLDLVRLLLVGIIFAVLFRSITGFIQRLITPDAYLLLQTVMFADFSFINKELLLIASIIIIAMVALAWKLRFVLDILMLGRNQALGLGVNYAKYTYLIIVIVAILVSTATALVGPMSFLGLLVCALTNQISKRMHHSIRIPAIMLVSSITLILGQGIFEHIFSMKSTLSVVVDGVGGVLFLLLLSKMMANKKGNI